MAVINFGSERVRDGGSGEIGGNLVLACVTNDSAPSSGGRGGGGGGGGVGQEEEEDREARLKPIAQWMTIGGDRLQLREESIEQVRLRGVPPQRNDDAGSPGGEC